MILSFPEADLACVLDAREKRARTQQELLDRYQLPVISFTLNIPGPRKATPLTYRAYVTGKERVLSVLKGLGISVFGLTESASAAGYEMTLCADRDAALLKQICTSIEDMDAIGRLFDIDVISPDGVKLERAPENERGCLVCGKKGRFCASRRVHSVGELEEKVNAIILSCLIDAEADHIASLCVRSLLDEACASPKPGLVDRFNRGSHEDMDIFTFTSSAASLHPYYRSCYRSGAEGKTLRDLQTAGLLAEETMYGATNGVNSHKGAIYTMGLLCAAAGRLEFANGYTGDPLTEEAWLQEVARIASEDRVPGGRVTHGSLTRAGGIKSEVALGLPHVRDISLPAFRTALSRGLSRNDAALYALLRLIPEAEDTNMLYRGGKAQARLAASLVNDALLRTDDLLPDRDTLEKLDQYFTSRRLSPGGCADLLAATLLIHDRLKEVT